MTLKPTQSGGGGGSGSVTSVSSADTSIAVATGTTTPVLTVAALNTIAANSAASGDIAMNSHKLTGLAAGSANGNSVRYEQAPAGILTAKGDLLGASAANTPGRLAVGSDGNVLTASSGDTLGIKWSASAALPTAGAAGQVVGYGGSSGTGAWVYPPGYELNYTQITSTVNVASTTEATGTTIISPGAIVFDGTPVICEFFSGVVLVPTSGAGDALGINLFEGATQITKLCFFGTPSITAQDKLTAYGKFRFTPSAASHTYTITAYATSTTGTPAIGAGSGGAAGFPPAFVRFTKV